MKFRLGRFVVQMLAFVSVLGMLVSISSSQEYPSRAIDIVAPFSAGGGVDTFFRNIREPLSRALNVAVNVVNRGGGSGVVGSSFVANSKPDGYTLLGHDLMIHLMPSAAMPKTVPYHVLEDFSPIAQIGVEPIIFYVRSDSEFKTMEDLVLYAKKNPGKLLAGASGVLTQNRINLEILKLSAGVDIHFVSFAGGGEVVISVLGGHTNFSNSPFSVTISHVKANKLRYLATCTPERISGFPALSTTKEKGFPDVNMNMRFGLLGPKGLSPMVIKKLANTVETILKSQEVISMFSRFGYIVNFLGPDQLRESLSRDFVTCSEIVKKADLKE